MTAQPGDSPLDPRQLRLDRLLLVAPAIDRGLVGDDRAQQIRLVRGVEQQQQRSQIDRRIDLGGAGDPHQLGIGAFALGARDHASGMVGPEQQVVLVDRSGAFRKRAGDAGESGVGRQPQARCSSGRLHAQPRHQARLLGGEPFDVARVLGLAAAQQLGARRGFGELVDRLQPRLALEFDDAGLGRVEVRLIVLQVVAHDLGALFLLVAAEPIELDTERLDDRAAGALRDLGRAAGDLEQQQRGLVDRLDADAADLARIDLHDVGGDIANLIARRDLAVDHFGAELQGPERLRGRGGRLADRLDLNGRSAVRGRQDHRPLADVSRGNQEVIAGRQRPDQRDGRRRQPAS